MSKLDTKPYKGVRDFYPEDQFIQNYIFGVWQDVVEKYGYMEYEASILEHSELYKEKSGEEIVNEQTYTFLDRGKREVTLRPEMTPTIARMISARKRELGFPLRWYSIPNLFRYEAPQRGRLREHWQLNVDLFGVSDIEADLEMIKIGSEILHAFGATERDFEIRLNSNASDEGSSLTQVVERLKSSGISNIKIDPSLARGQSYYTGVIFEFFDTSKENPRSILGGGRFDNLLSLFDEESIPAVGFGMGDVTIKNFLETHGLLPKFKPSTHLCIALTSLKHSQDAKELAEYLRHKNVNLSIDWSGRKIGDQIKTADKLHIPYVLVLGENEIKSKVFSVKNMQSGKESEASKEDIPDIVRE